MIRFQCPHCDGRLQVPDTHAGTEGRCPRCKKTVTAPSVPSSERPILPDATPEAATAPPKALDRQLLDLPAALAADDDSPAARLREKEALARLGFTPLPECAGERQFPWPIDVLLYPANTAGLTTLAIVVGIPFLLTVVNRLLGSFLSGAAFVIHLLIGLYGGWYLVECIYDSAHGGTRAPPGFDAGGLADMKSRMINVVGVFVVFAWPPGIYHIWTHQTDTVFWVLVAWGIVLFPMGLIAMAMLDSSEALNPLLLLGSIRRTFLPYLGLLLPIASLVGLAWLLPHGPAHQPPPLWLQAIEQTLGGYAVLVIAHIFGRFYWRYRERLDWGL